MTDEEKIKEEMLKRVKILARMRIGDFIQNNPQTDNFQIEQLPNLIVEGFSHVTSVGLLKMWADLAVTAWEESVVDPDAGALAERKAIVDFLERDRRSDETGVFSEEAARAIRRGEHLKP